MNCIDAEVELLEAEAWSRMHTAWMRRAPACGLQVRRWGRATSLATPGVAAAAVNRAIGFGVEAPLDRELLEEVRQFYRGARRNRWYVEWSPAADARAAGILECAGGSVRGVSAKLVAMLKAVPPAPATGTVTVVEVTATDASRFADIVGPALGVPEGGRAGIVAPIGESGWHYYLAMVRGTVCAGAAMFTLGQGAWFGLSGTLEAYRGCGAQSALLARRIADARASGCGWVSAETHPIRADMNPSMRNMMRAVFELLYQRPWYRFDEASV